MELTVNDRINSLIENVGSNPNAFAEKIGVNATVIYNIIKGRKSKPSFEVLQKIFSSYYALNVLWLIKGEGEIWVEEMHTEQSLIERKVTLDLQVKELLASVEANLLDDYIFPQLEELINSLTKENNDQKRKIKELYDKQNQILDVFRKRLNLDI
ncbi:MAG: transcriptional regulator with XRE-family HTH domain [Cyclobacteriaceae bacterium]|jgi:transcriptional regulator with XRE-family HTH domain